MQKDDLKSLVTQIYHNLLEEIDAQEDATKEQVVTYLKDAASVVSNINCDQIDSIEHAKLAFMNAYKEIADKSLTSYENTNERFKELTEMHQETIAECYDKHIDLKSITTKFNEIQSHMTEEVNKANMVISELSQQVKTLEETSNLDHLTKVFNRRALTSHLDMVCAKENISDQLHLLILDIDDFKMINDKYGHVAGDKILIFIANILRKTLRDGDKIFRYGGEEFILVLNRISMDQCKTIAERLLELVRSNRLIYKGENINVTISIGCTELKTHDNPDSIVSRADKALYRAKHNGKDQMQTEL